MQRVRESQSLTYLCMYVCIRFVVWVFWLWGAKRRATACCSLVGFRSKFSTWLATSQGFLLHFFFSFCNYNTYTHWQICVQHAKIVLANVSKFVQLTWVTFIQLCKMWKLSCRACFLARCPPDAEEWGATKCAESSPIGNQNYDPDSGQQNSSSECRTMNGTAAL